VVLLTPVRQLTDPMRVTMEQLARRHDVAFILGHTAPGRDAAVTYDRLASCLAVARQVVKDRLVVEFDDFAVYEPLTGMSRAQASLIVRDTLGALWDEPAATLRESLRTLRALVHVRWVATEAAKELTVHPNTVRNRVTALARITGLSFADAKDLERLSTAIRLLEMYPTLLTGERD
jgi:DNA-binding PucR family transcriptional regulator